MLGAVSPRRPSARENRRDDAVALQGYVCSDGNMIARRMTPAGDNDRRVVGVEADQGRDVGAKEAP
jgi:hypothetical protein